MWNALKQFVLRMNEEGRAKFNHITLDSERSTATVSNALMMASLVAAVLTSLYFVLFLTLILIYARELLVMPQVWFALLFISFRVGCIQGGMAGAILGWGQAEYWQGKRNKAGSICAFGGAILIAALALYEAQAYSPDIPMGDFIFWAAVIFSPGYLAATSLIAWGLSLLNID